MATSVTGGASTNTATGLGQGIDVNQFVQLALAGDLANISARQATQTALTAQSTALSKITTDLNTLSDAAFALNDPLGSLNGLAATSSDTSQLSATAATSATPGVHTIVVNNLATTSSFYSDAVASSSALFASGTFQVSAGGTQVASITVGANNNTLDQIAASINNQTTAVRASVINDANGSRLALVSSVTGAPGNLSVTGSLTASDANNTVVNFNQAVLGKNASLTVDGVPISSTSNTVSGVINGVTLSLVSAKVGSPVTLTVNPDTSKASDAINTFVSAYNTTIKDINAQFAFSSTSAGTGPLEADGSLRDAQSALLGAVTFSAAGNNGAVNLASIGVNLNNDGTLSVDSSALATALSSNFSGVQGFLQSPTAGFAKSLSTTINNLTDSSSGILGLDAKGIAQSSQDLAQQISDLQASLVLKQQQLTSIYARVNTTLQQLPLLQAQLSQQLASA
jgi:flagellar hook-associated protein 2